MEQETPSNRLRELQLDWPTTGEQACVSGKPEGAGIEEVLRPLKDSNSLASSSTWRRHVPKEEKGKMKQLHASQNGSQENDGCEP